MYNAYQTLKRRGICTWDANQNLTVIQGHIGAARGISFTVIFVSLYFGLILLGGMYQQELKEAANTPTASYEKQSKSFEPVQWEWTNPITKKKIYIESSWAEQEKPKDSPETLLTLLHNSEGLIIYLIHERFDYDVSLSDYIDALEKVKQEDLGLIDFSPDSNKKYYSSYGKFDFEGSIMDSYVRAWSDDSRNYWHYVVISDYKTNMLTDDTSEILTSLIKSTKNDSKF